MITFTIDAENNITAYSGATMGRSGANGGRETFGSERELARVSKGWPVSRLVAIWNGLPGVTAVKKFQDRDTAVTRIWKAIETLQPIAERRRGERGRKSGADCGTAERGTGREGTKKARVLALLRAPGGVTLPALMEATGWQAHSVRGFVSGTVGRKMGLAVESCKREDGRRVYRINPDGHPLAYSGEPPSAADPGTEATA